MRQFRHGYVRWLQRKNARGGTTDDESWKRYRARVRRRAAAQMILILAPLLLLGLVARVVITQDFPAGDLRSEPAFWLAFGVAMAIPVGAAVALAIRTLRD